MGPLAALFKRKSDRATTPPSTPLTLSAPISPAGPRALNISPRRDRDGCRGPRAPSEAALLEKHTYERTEARLRRATEARNGLVGGTSPRTGSRDGAQPDRRDDVQGMTAQLRRVELGSPSARGPLPTPPRPTEPRPDGPSHSASYAPLPSIRANLPPIRNSVSFSNDPPTYRFPTSPTSTRPPLPPRPSTSPQRSPYAQEIPSPQRAPPRPFSATKPTAPYRQVIPTAPNTPAGSRNVTPRFPGSFPPVEAIPPPPPSRHPPDSHHPPPRHSLPPQRSTPSNRSLVESTNLRTPEPRPAPRTLHSDPGKMLRTPPLVTRPGIEQSSSAEDIPSHKNRCQGTTAKSKRCTRIVNDSGSSSVPTSPVRSPARKAGGATALDRLDAMLVGSVEDGVGRFCHQHSAQSLAERGCFAVGRDGRGQWVAYDEWILADLPIATVVLLRHEMSRPVSAKDEPGYIYVHEMVETKGSRQTQSRTTQIKIGRSKTPVARLAQWRALCPSREPIVRNIYPTDSSGAGMSGALRVAPSGLPNHHRWERLVLIEIAGRAASQATYRPEPPGSAGGTRNCRDCGSLHLELFEVDSGAYELWIDEVIQRWARFCSSVLA